MKTTSREISEAITRIVNTDAPFVWVRVSKKRKTYSLINCFHASIRRALVRLGLFYNVNTTTRRNTPYLVIDKRVRQ